jgi:hypothetical protein
MIEEKVPLKGYGRLHRLAYRVFGAGADGTPGSDAYRNRSADFKDDH